MEYEENIYCIDDKISGLRLDKALSVLIPELSRSRIQKLIEDKMISVNGSDGKWASSKVREGMEISVKIPVSQDLEVEAENLDLDVVYEDEYLIVINKPAGMVVHPAPGNTSATLVNGLLYHCGDSLSGIGGIKRPGIVHRIDKETSGLIVVAKTDAVHQGLSEKFASHDIERKYWAIVYNLKKPQASINAAIGRSPFNRKKMAVVEGGKHAVTHYKELSRRGNVSLIECQLETGRTHQIRVHMTHIGSPLVGDSTYCNVTKQMKKDLPSDMYHDILEFNRQALHAKTLGFEHPISKKVMVFNSDLPMDMMRLKEYFDYE